MFRNVQKYAFQSGGKFPPHVYYYTVDKYIGIRYFLLQDKGGYTIFIIEKTRFREVVNKNKFQIKLRVKLEGTVHK